jgi:SAM-dependent methyltransferase
MIPSTQVKADIRAHYDKLADKFLSDVKKVRDASESWRQVEGDRPSLAYFRRRKVQTALALGRFAPGATIAEIGCGTGDYTFLFARLGFKMIGVDLSPRSIETARAKASIIGSKDVSFIVSDAEELSEIADNTLDGVVSFSALRYVPNLPNALRAIRRILRPNGVAVVDFPNKYCPWFRLLKNYFGVETHIHDHQLSTRQLLAALNAAGFCETAAKRILFTTYVLPGALLPLFKLFDTVGERLPVINQSAGIIVASGAKR